MTYTRQSGPSNRVVSDENIFLLRASRSRTEYRYRQKLKSDSRRHSSIPPLHEKNLPRRSCCSGKPRNWITDRKCSKLKRNCRGRTHILLYLHAFGTCDDVGTSTYVLVSSLYNCVRHGSFLLLFHLGLSLLQPFRPYPPPQPHRSRNIIRRPRPSDRFEIRVYTRGDGANTRREGGGGEGVRALLLKELFTGRRRRLLN